MEHCIFTPSDDSHGRKEGCRVRVRTAVESGGWRGSAFNAVSQIRAEKLKS